MRLFAVVGMHRSGTSTVARLVNLLGAYLGDERDLLSPKPDNPRGFWESRHIVQFHDEVLEFLGGRWDRPPLLFPGWEGDARLEPFRQRLRRIVASYLQPNVRIAVWKDPRGSLLLPLWRTVVPIAGTLHCIRDPDEVVGSLAARDNFDSERGAALWLRYVVAAWLDDAAQIVVGFERACDEPRELISNLSAFIGGSPPTDATVTAVEEFIDRKMHHLHPQVPDPGPHMRLARSVHTLIATQPRGVVSPLIAQVAASWRGAATLSAEE